MFFYLICVYFYWLCLVNSPRLSLSNFFVCIMPTEFSLIFILQFLIVVVCKDLQRFSLDFSLNRNQVNLFVVLSVILKGVKSRWYFCEQNLRKIDLPLQVTRILKKALFVEKIELMCNPQKNIFVMFGCHLFCLLASDFHFLHT